MAPEFQLLRPEQLVGPHELQASGYFFRLKPSRINLRLLKRIRIALVDEIYTDIRRACMSELRVVDKYRDFCKQLAAQYSTSLEEDEARLAEVSSVKDLLVLSKQ